MGLQGLCNFNERVEKGSDGWSAGGPEYSSTPGSTKLPLQLERKSSDTKCPEGVSMEGARSDPARRIAAERIGGMVNLTRPATCSARVLNHKPLILSPIF